MYNKPIDNLSNYINFFIWSL